ncbi:MAG: hypothetical protein BZ136_09625 [Methanosphaera sp. rholeuAM74]|nr:MAG: hypothetical protein BZ136_09625 [Methanosphaera sp. rholeuAM74]
MKNKQFRKKLSLLIALMMALSMFCISFTFVCAESGIEEARIKETSDYINIPGVMWKGESRHISVSSSSGKMAEITKIQSSDTSVVKKVKGIDSLKALKKGKVFITVNYKFSKKETGTRTVPVQVKAYPNNIKSLTVNGKSVTIKKHKFSYTDGKYKKTSLKIKMALKDGWKISDVWGFISRKGKSNQIKISKATIQKGGKISFPKKYTSMYITVVMKNNKGEQFIYDFNLYR